MSIHVTGGGATPRQVVISCDVAGCPVQIEPPAAEHWRSDPDAESWARDHAAGWTHDAVRGTDYCPDHAEFATPPVDDASPPRLTATVRDRAGNPLDRDDYAASLRALLSYRDIPTVQPPTLTAAQVEVAARLLDELSGVYRGESLGALAGELSQQLESKIPKQD